MILLKYIEWKELHGKKVVKGFFISTPKGYLKVNILSGEFYELGDEARVYNVIVTPLGKVVKDDG